MKVHSLKKVCLLCMGVTIGLLAVVFGYQHLQNPQLRWPTNGIYFAKWDAYHYYTQEENPYLQFSIFYIHDQTLSEFPTIQDCKLVSQTGEMYPLESITLQLNDEQIPCSLYNLSGSLPCLSPGKYVFESIVLSLTDGESKYPIGTWEIEIGSSQMQEDAQVISIGKHTFIDGAFENYRIELKNNLDIDIDIADFICRLSNNDMDYSIIQTDDYYQTGNNASTVLPPNEKRTFVFIFDHVPTDTQFFSIKPQIIYKYEDTQYILKAPTAIYSPVLTNEDICSYLNNTYRTVCHSSSKGYS